MPDKMYLNEQRSIIRVDSVGAISAQDLFDSFLSMLKLCGSHNISKVLVDATKQTSLPSPFDLLEFGSRMSEGKVREDMMFAIVGSDNTSKDQNFLETVVRNRGGQFVQFDSVEEAINWLEAG